MKQKEQDAFYIQWHFIESCNLRCVHCYQHNYKKEHLAIEKLIQIAENIDMALCKWNKKGRISLTGGEPFLKLDLLFTLLDYFEKSKTFYWIGLLTNGTLINDVIANRLEKYSKLSELQISIDGSTSENHDKIRGKGSFDKAINSVKILKKHGFFISIMFTLHKQNKNEVIPMLELAERLGVDAITIERITPMNKEDIKRFYMSPEELHDTYKKIYDKKLEIEKNSKLKIRVSRPLWTLLDNNIGGFCPAGLTSLAILYDGTVLPCRRLEIPLGNILKDGLFKIWYTSPVLWRLRNKNRLLGKCNNCKFLHACGGCRAIAYTVNGDYMAEDPQCWI